MTETDNKTRYGRIAVILIALAIVIAAFVSFIAMNNERIYEQNTKYLQGSTEQSARRISEWMTDSQTEIKLLSSMYESTLSSVDEISAAGIEQLANYTKFDYTTISLSDGLTIDDKGQEADASDREYFARGMEGESGVWRGREFAVLQRPLRHFLHAALLQGRGGWRHLRRVSGRFHGEVPAHLYFQRADQHLLARPRPAT